MTTMTLPAYNLCRTLCGSVSWNSVAVNRRRDRESRTLRGCVSWNEAQLAFYQRQLTVASFTGAWVEIFHATSIIDILSHTLHGGVLKWNTVILNALCIVIGRTNHGCVSKNATGIFSNSINVAPFTGVWVEITMPTTRLYAIVSHPTRVRELKCRT